jgi:kynureninase
MSEKDWNLDRNLASIREEFPILSRCVYLISNSLGAVPQKARYYLESFYTLWAEEGVSAWAMEWWNLSRKVANQVASIIGAGEDEVAMMTNATQSHWASLSTKFADHDKKRNKIVMTDHDFPSIIYAMSNISKFTGWKIDMVKSNGRPYIDVEKILQRIDEQTLFVATSHVYFKSAYVQDISRISAKARKVGALTIIDGYHAPGVIPVDVKELDVDFYIGGCLKWLCGGPGNAFLYVRPEAAKSLKPALTGWFAHSSPFSFSEEMDYTYGSYRFMSGTPPIACLYTALAGLDIVKKIGIPQIRKKSLQQTELIIKKAKERGFKVFTPENGAQRGGAVSIAPPHTFQVKQALDKKGIKVDFRKGKGTEPDVIRVAPHFYTKNEEIEIFYKEIDEIYSSGVFQKYPDRVEHVT